MGRSHRIHLDPILDPSKFKLEDFDNDLESTIENKLVVKAHDIEGNVAYLEPKLAESLPISLIFN